MILSWPGDFLLGTLGIMFWISVGVIGSNVKSLFMTIIIILLDCRGCVVWIVGGVRAELCLQTSGESSG